MKGADKYCASCFRTIAAGDDLCARCANAETRTSFRPLLLLGAIGLTVIVVGASRFDLHLCIAGAAIAIIGVLIHVCIVTVRAIDGD